MRKFCLYITLFLAAFAYSQSYSSSSLLSPKERSADEYVSNPDGVLSAECVSDINRQAAALERQVEVEMAVAAINRLNSDDAFSFALNLFNTWGVGRAGKNSGVLVLLVVESRDVQIITGGGLEGLLPDAVCKRIIEEDMVPMLSVGDYDGGILSGVAAISKRLLTDEAQAELLLDMRRKDTEAADMLMLYLSAAFILLILLSVYAYGLLNNNLGADNNIRFRHARTGRAIFVILSLVFPFPILFLALYYRRACRRLRTAPVQCPACHHTMRLLSEEEEDRWLSPLQQAEESVHSADYDVWLCPSCMNHIIMPYESSATSRYSRCPNCGGRTYTMTSDIVVRPPSSLREGQGLRTWQCKHCAYREQKPYAIAKTPDVIVLQGGGRGGSSSFGGGAGSFGGGISFGGGAGGKF